MRQNNLFQVEIDGIDVLLVQEIDMPEIERPALTYGNYAGLPDVKIPSAKKKIGDATIKKVKPMVGFENFLFQWLSNPIPRNIVVREVNELGITIGLNIWLNCFPTKLSQTSMKRGEDPELIIEEATIAIYDVEKA
jgi:hypothetical protein